MKIFINCLTNRFLNAKKKSIWGSDRALVCALFHPLNGVGQVKKARGESLPMPAGRHDATQIAAPITKLVAKNQRISCRDL